MALYSIRIGSFCAGIAGLDLGVKIALRRSRTVVLCERDSYAAAALVGRMEGSALDRCPVWDSVDTFPAEQFYGCLDLLLAGYPCQPFSVAGKRLGEADRRHLWPHIERIIRETGVDLVFLENVAGHLNLGFPTVRQGLRAMGFQVKAGIFTAEEAGPPHERKRLFILAYRSRRRLRELRESLRCNGLTNWSGGELGNGHDWDSTGTGAGRSDAAISIAGPSAQLADTSNGRIPQPGRGPQRGNGAGSAGEEPPDGSFLPIETGVKTAVEGRQERGKVDRCGERDEFLEHTNQPRPAEPDRQLGHASSSEHPQRRSLDGNTREELPPTPGAGIPLFPPGRNDREAWSRIKEIRPDLWPAVEPEVLRMADGTADWVDPRGEQLRCTGNAVFPLQAALAFTTLVIEADH